MLSFGGPAAQIALMHKVIVEQRRWLKESQYLNALSFCMLLPGPEAMQLATYAGWRTHGVLGGLIAGLCFVLPGALIILLLAMTYVLYGTQSVTVILFMGIKAAVLVIVLDALIKVSKRALIKRHHKQTAVLSFIALFVFAVPFPLVVLLAGIYGWVKGQAASTHNADVTLPDGHLVSTLRTVGIWLLIWWLPIGLLWIVSDDQMLMSLALFFSKLAVVSFGGAYAVLAYMAQDVVTHYQWLSAPQMMDALGLAETTPGPLILVTQFVGFLAGFSHAGMAYAVLAACLTLWVTFVPCFLWIFAGAPYMQWLSGQPRLQGALSNITAAVVGVIANLSLWFALHVLFDQVSLMELGPAQIWSPQWASFNLPTVGFVALAAVLLFGLKQSVITTIVVCAAVVLLVSALGLPMGV